jgi:long-chain fatty acid transport protein
MRPFPPRLAISLAALLLLPVAARGNGFALDIQGVYANGTAGAAAGDPRGPAVQFVNPAGLAALDGTRVAAGGMLVYARAPYTDAGSTLAVGGRIPGQDAADGATTGEVPWAFASQRVSPNLTVGFGLTTPFGLATDYGRDFVGRYQGIESRIESLAFGPAVGWHVGGRMNVGAAISARRDHVVQSLALDMNAVCAAILSAPNPPGPGDFSTCANDFGLTPGEADGYGRFVGEGWSWTTTLGATLEPVEGTMVGLAWRHEVRSTIRGDESFALPPAGAAFLAFASARAAEQNPPQTVSNLTGSRAAMQLRLPDFLTLHASHREGPVTVLAAFQWTRWKDFDRITLVADSPATGLDVPSEQGYRNALRLALGAAWAALPGRLDVYGGAAYEQTPIRDAFRQATLPEVNSILVGLGGEITIAAGFSLAAGWQHVEATGPSRIDQTGAAGDRVVGTARMRADLLLAQLGWRR